jgi:hypothetical protein
VSKAAVEEAALRRAVEQAGATWVGIQPRRGAGPLLLFNDRTGSTRSVALDGAIEIAVRRVLLGRRPERLEAILVRLVAEVGAIRTALEGQAR